MLGKVFEMYYSYRSADHLRRTSTAFPILPGTSIPGISQHMHKEYKQEEKFHCMFF